MLQVERTSFRIMGPSPNMELALSWMSRYVGPTPSSWGGAMGCGGSEERGKLIGDTLNSLAR